MACVITIIYMLFCSVSEALFSHAKHFSEKSVSNFGNDAVYDTNKT